MVTIPCFLSTILLWPFLLALVSSDSPPANDMGECPRPEDIVYSPFTRYSDFGPGQNCWGIIICVFGRADEARKQQLSAVALIMGFLPLLMKDLTWPHRNELFVSRRPCPWPLDVFVRAMGLVPFATGSERETRRLSQQSSAVARWAWKQPRARIARLSLSSLALLLCGYVALAAMEFSSKRSILDCTNPTSILFWHVLAYAPALLHTLWDRLKGRRSSGPARRVDNNNLHLFAPRGTEDEWPAQLVWAVYYLVGSLFYTSIAAVTGVELSVWIIRCFCITAASRWCALLLPLWGEHTGPDSDGFRLLPMPAPQPVTPSAPRAGTL